MIGMVADPELPPDDRRHPLGGPDITAKAERLGPLRQQHRHLRPLLRRQLRHGPGGAGASARRPRPHARAASTGSPPQPSPPAPPQSPAGSTPSLSTPTPAAVALHATPSAASYFLCHTSAPHSPDHFSLLRGDQFSRCSASSRSSPTRSGRTAAAWRHRARPLALYFVVPYVGTVLVASGTSLPSVPAPGSFGARCDGPARSADPAPVDARVVIDQAVRWAAWPRSCPHNETAHRFGLSVAPWSRCWRAGERYCPA